MQDRIELRMILLYLLKGILKVEYQSVQPMTPCRLHQVNLIRVYHR